MYQKDFPDSPLECIFDLIRSQCSFPKQRNARLPDVFSWPRLQPSFMLVDVASLMIIANWKPGCDQILNSGLALAIMHMKRIKANKQILGKISTHWHHPMQNTTAPSSLFHVEKVRTLLLGSYERFRPVQPLLAQKVILAQLLIRPEQADSHCTSRGAHWVFASEIWQKKLGASSFCRKRTTFFQD